MKAMILAAGLGNRMRPLTDHTPKPLLKVNGRPLIEHHIRRLLAAGVDEIVINVAYLGDQIKHFIASRDEWRGLITICDEGQPLETAGGVVNALSYLGEDPFLIFNGDVWIDFPLSLLVQKANQLKHCDPSVHLLLVDNPEHNKDGDFRLSTTDADRENNRLTGKVGLLKNTGEALTYSGVGIYHPQLFKNLSAGIRPLGPLLREWISRGIVTGEKCDGFWLDVGTPERLKLLDDFLVKAS